MTDSQRDNLEKLAFSNEANRKLALQIAIGLGEDVIDFVCDRIMVSEFMEQIKGIWSCVVEIPTRRRFDQMASPQMVKETKRRLRWYLKKWGFSEIKIND